MPKARLLFDERTVMDDGAILTAKLWRVPEPVPPSTHCFKYALFYGRPGVRLVLFDNERGKGDHKHIREVQTPYLFEDVSKLVHDFYSAVKKLREEAE